MCLSNSFRNSDMWIKQAGGRRGHNNGGEIPQCARVSSSDKHHRTTHGEYTERETGAREERAILMKYYFSSRNTIDRPLEL